MGRPKKVQVKENATETPLGKNPDQEAFKKIFSMMDSMAGTIGAVSDMLGTMNERITKLETEPDISVSTTVNTKVRKSEVPQSPLLDEDLAKYPVPIEVRETVSEVLNNRFRILVKPSRETPTYQLFIIVPSEYTNATKSYLELNKVDIRTKVIGYADGTHAVRDYAIRVFENFPIETRTRIIADKAANPELPIAAT